MQSGWRVGSLFGIPFFIDTSWFAILLLVAYSYGADPTWQQTWGVVAWGMGLLLALLLFASVLLHELGHSLAAKMQGINVNSITLFLFGGIASIDQESKTPGGAFQVAIAGPLVSLGIYLLLATLSQLPGLPLAAQVLVWNVAQINLVLTLFNLIPGLPLDGGQVLKAAVWKITQSRIKGVRWAASTGQILGWLAIVLGLFAVVTYQFWFGLWIAAIGWFAIRNASAYSRVTDLQEALASLTAGDAMVREFRVIDANMTLRQFADEYLLQEKRSPFYFAASDGRYRGLVEINDLRTIERSEWETRTVQSMAKPLLDIPSAREKTPLSEVVTHLEADSLPRVTVLTPADAVAGTIDRGDIVRALATKLGLAVPEALIQRIKEDGQYPAGLQIPAIAKSALD